MEKSKFDNGSHNKLKNKTIALVKKLIFDKSYIKLIINRLPHSALRLNMQLVDF